MFPQLIKPRSYSLNIDKYGMQQKSRTNNSHYSYKIVEKLHSQPITKINLIPQKEIQGSLIIIVYDCQAFLKIIYQNHKYQQFLKFKEFLNKKQVDQFTHYISNFFINQVSESYGHHYCTFRFNNKPIDLEEADSKTIFEVIMEFLSRNQQQQEIQNIYGMDFQLVHKSNFKQVLFISRDRIEKLLNYELRPNENIYRFKTQIQTTIIDKNLDDQCMDSRIYQIGMHKKNKEIKNYLQQQNNEIRDKESKKGLMKELQVKKVKQCYKEKKVDLVQELPQICDQIFDKFKKLFQIETLLVDRDTFSQFLLLCELSMYYSKNITLQQQLSRLSDDNEKFRLLINNVLYFEFRVLKSMNLNLQQLNSSITQTLLKFINQDTKNQENITKIYWKAFMRFTTIYVDQQWSTSDFRYFLLLLNDESPLTLQTYLQLPLREQSKTIFTLSEDLLKQIVWQILYTKQM